MLQTLKPVTNKLATFNYFYRVNTREEGNWPFDLEFVLDLDRKDCGVDSNRVMTSKDFIDFDECNLENPPKTNLGILEETVYQDMTGCFTEGEESMTSLHIVRKNNKLYFKGYHGSYTTGSGYLELRVEIDDESKLINIPIGFNSGYGKDMYSMDCYTLPTTIRVTGINPYLYYHHDGTWRLCFPYVECYMGENVHWLNNTDTQAQDFVVCTDILSDFDPEPNTGGGSTPSNPTTYNALEWENTWFTGEQAFNVGSGIVYGLVTTSYDDPTKGYIKSTASESNVNIDTQALLNVLLRNKQFYALECRDIINAEQPYLAISEVVRGPYSYLKFNGNYYDTNFNIVT